MDDGLPENVFSLKNDDFYEFIQVLVGQQMADILKFQSITSTQSLIRNPNIFAIFNMNSSESSFLMIRERSCFQLDNGAFIVKIGLNVQYVFDSEDCTGIVKRIKYDSTTNTFTGFPSLLGRGVPVKSYYQTDSFDALKLWLNSIDKASLLNVHMIQPVQSTDNSSIPSPYLLSAYGIDNIATANDILQRWWYILFNQSLQRNVRIIDADPKYLPAMRLMSGFLGALPNFQVHQYPQAFQIKIRSHWSWFYLGEQQLLLFFQDPTHLVTKWRNRLLSATAELCLGNQSISINYLHDIIENDTYSKLDHGLSKSDINPKYRQNFSSCLKLTSNDLFNILNATADTRGTLLYFQVLKMIIVAYIEKTTTIVESEYLCTLDYI
ncbi:unnamed protein product [Rotaria socialis]